MSYKLDRVIKYLKIFLRYLLILFYRPYFTFGPYFSRVPNICYYMVQARSKVFIEDKELTGSTTNATRLDLSEND